MFKLHHLKLSKNQKYFSKIDINERDPELSDSGNFWLW